MPGWAWVLIVLGILGVLMIVAIVACTALFVDAADEAVENIDEATGEVPADDYELEIESCEVDEFLGATAGGTFTNNTGERQGFEVNIEFFVDGTRVDGQLTIIETLDDGESTTFEVTSIEEIDEDADLECELDSVNRTFFDEQDVDLFD
jgi:hypothetical protein